MRSTFFLRISKNSWFIFQILSSFVLIVVSLRFLRNYNEIFSEISQIDEELIKTSFTNFIIYVEEINRTLLNFNGIFIIVGSFYVIIKIQIFNNYIYNRFNFLYIFNFQNQYFSLKTSFIFEKIMCHFVKLQNCLINTKF